MLVPMLVILYHEQTKFLNNFGHHKEHPIVDPYHSDMAWFVT